MEQLDLKKILKETRDSVRNGHSVEQLEIWKKQLRQLNKEDRNNLKFAIQILEEVIKLKKNNKENKTKKNFIKHKQVFLFIFFVSILVVASASINYKINGETKLSVTENFTTISNILEGKSPLKIFEEISFVNSSGQEHFSIYHAEIGLEGNSVPDAFLDSLIFQTNRVNNENNMEVCFWDNETQVMHMCINQGETNRATTIRRSLQIVGNKTLKENDENFTLCEENNYIDCSTDETGADLLVQDDIEAIGSIYANENIVATGNIEIGGNLTLSDTFAKLGIGNMTDFTPFQNTSYADQGIEIRGVNPFLILNEIGGSRISIEAGTGRKMYMKSWEDGIDTNLYSIMNDGTHVFDSHAQINVSAHRFELGEIDGGGTNTSEIVLYGANGLQESSMLSFFEDSYQNNGIEFNYDSQDNQLQFLDWTGGSLQASPIMYVQRGGTDAVVFPHLSGSGNDYACLDSVGKLYRSATAC